MSLSEQQIRAIVKDELRKIIDAGLMYTVECKPQAEKQGTPSNQPSSPATTSPPNDVLSKFPENLRQHLTLKDGKIYKKFVAPELFEQMNQIAIANGYKWISDGKNSRWEKA